LIIVSGLFIQNSNDFLSVHGPACVPGMRVSGRVPDSARRGRQTIWFN